MTSTRSRVCSNLGDFNAQYGMYLVILVTSTRSTVCSNLGDFNARLDLVGLTLLPSASMRFYQLILTNQGLISGVPEEAAISRRKKLPFIKWTNNRERDREEKLSKPKIYDG